MIKSGDNLLSRYSHYHRPQVLNGRVRNGNGCGHLGKVTGNSLWPSVSSQWSVAKNATVKVLSLLRTTDYGLDEPYFKWQRI